MTTALTALTRELHEAAHVHALLATVREHSWCVFALGVAVGACGMAGVVMWWRV